MRADVSTAKTLTSQAVYPPIHIEIKGDMMFKPSFTKFLTIYCVAIIGFTALNATDTFDTDPRHKFVRGIQQQYAKDIETRRQHLNTSYSGVALIDIAREQLENEITASTNSGTDWSLVINCVISGYGYRGGVSKTEVANPVEAQVMRLGYMLSATYQIAQGNSAIIELTDIYSPGKGSDLQLSEHVRVLNTIASLVPKEIHELAAKQQMVEKCEREEGQKREQSLTQLHTYNAWHAHERFYCVAGVLKPETSDVLHKVFVAYKGTAMGFVGNLTRKLDLAIANIKGNPAPETVVDLVELAQQILLTLSAGIPGKDGNFARLAPSNRGDWEIIRKALFLALSVTSNPSTAGNTFLSTLYDCGSFCSQKTDADSVKEYYWRLEAYGKSFSSLWKGLAKNQPENTIKGWLDHELALVDPMYQDILGIADINKNEVTKNQPVSKFNFEYPASHSVKQRAYEAAIRAIVVTDVRKELTAALVLHPKFKHDQAFRTLYPDLTLWATNHSPSLKAKALMTGTVVKLNLPKNFQPQAIHLSYQGGKWQLLALRLNSQGDILGKEILWSQGNNLKASLVGSLEDAQGTHLFNFEVDGSATTIKAISTGYMVQVGADGAITTVANGKELGIIESSAYPLHAGTNTNVADSGITIIGKAYYGNRGSLRAKRNSVWVSATDIALKYPQGFTVKTHNNKPYNFYRPDQGHGIEAGKDVVLFGDTIDLAFSQVIAQQNLKLHYLSDECKSITTHGSLLHAGDSLAIDGLTWDGDTQTVFAGSDGSSHVQNPSDLTTNSTQAQLSYGRLRKHSVWNLTFLNDEERKVLTQGPEVYGNYFRLIPRMPSFYTPVIQAPVYQSTGRRNNSGSSGGSNFVSSQSYRQSLQQPMSQHGQSLNQLSYQGFDFSISNRGGNINTGLSIKFSDIGTGASNILGFNHSHGSNGNHLNVSSTYIQPSITQSLQQWSNPSQQNLALTLHRFSSALIQQITEPKKLSVLPLILPALYAGGSLTTTGTVVLSTATGGIGAILLKKGLEGTRESLDARKGACSGMPDPDDDEKRKKGCEKSESPVWKEFKHHKGEYKTNAKGDEIYKWDYTHNDIEIFNKRGEHLGSMDPLTAVRYKGPKHPPIKL